MKKDLFKSKKLVAYLMLILVIFTWGVSPPLNYMLNNDYSVAFRTAVVALISAISITLVCIKRLKFLSVEYFKRAVITGIFLSLASLVQKIGLLYTTPTKYAFLENLSVVVVPIVLFFTIRKKPSLLTIIAIVLCLVGMFILTGMDFSGNSFYFGIGELLCSLAGVLYGVNIAYTGIVIKKLDTLLYLFVQLWTGVIISFLSAFLLSIIKIDGVPIETIKFSFDVGGLLLIVLLAIVFNVLCWFLRTYAMKYVNPNAVSIMMPFSAVVTGIISVVLGMDTLTFSFVVGGVISLIAIILSGNADVKESKKEDK